MDKVPGLAQGLCRPLGIVEWTTGTATSSMLSKRRISPSGVSPTVKLPSVS
ncbi:hypothetical protein ABIE49_000044 [Bradyrhizobium sp. OAE829]